MTNQATLTVSATDVGDCTLRFNQAGDDRWLAAPEVIRTVPTAKAIPTFSGFHSGTLEKPLGNSFILPLRAQAGGAPIVYGSLTPPVPSGWQCDVANNTLTLNGRDRLPTDCVIYAKVDGSRLYEAATVQATITITPSNVYMEVSDEKSSGNVKTLTITFAAAVALTTPASDCAAIVISPVPGGASTAHVVTATFNAAECSF